MTPPSGPVVTAAGSFPDFVTTQGALKQVLPRVTPAQSTYAFKDCLGQDIAKFSLMLHRRVPSTAQVAARIDIFKKYIALGA